MNHTTGVTNFSTENNGVELVVERAGKLDVLDGLSSGTEAIFGVSFLVDMRSFIDKFLALKECLASL